MIVWTELNYIRIGFLIGLSCYESCDMSLVGWLIDYLTIFITDASSALEHCSGLHNHIVLILNMSDVIQLKTQKVCSLT